MMLRQGRQRRRGPGLAGAAMALLAAAAWQPASASSAQPASSARSAGAQAKPAQAKPTAVRPAVARAPAAPKPAITPAATSALAAGASAVVAAQPVADDFASYIESLWPAAQARGVSRATFDGALGGLTPDHSIIALTRKQSEFTAPIWSYLDSAVAGARVPRGQAVAAQWADTLAAAEARYRVPREIVLGIWGMETGFGSATGDKDTVRSLATLAHARYRGDFFEGELLTALTILEQRHVERGRMRGSWAGAMGHTQFMPTSFVKHAVDANGDGRKDIWGTVPDALASTANYLRDYGWEPGLPWGLEVAIPERVDWRTTTRDFSAWTAAGVRAADGSALPVHGQARLFLPAGARGPAFLVTANYDVIKKYNNSDAYALAVAHLGDRIAGRAAIRGEWPRRDPPLGKAEREGVQRRLKALGFYDAEVDGRLGSSTRDAIRNFQLAADIDPADGYPSPELVQRLKLTR